MRLLILAWLSVPALASAAAEQILYTQHWTNEARGGPGAYFALKGTIIRGVALNVLKFKGDWAQLSLEPIIGQKGAAAWMARSCLAPALPQDSAMDKARKARDRFVPPARDLTAVAAVRGFAVRYGRAKPSAIDELGKMQPPFFTPDDYAAFKTASGSPRPDASAPRLLDRHRAVLADYDIDPKEEGIGLGIAATVASKGLDEDRALLRYLNELGTLLSEASGAYARSFKLYALRDDQVNAVSVPGGWIFLSRPLLAVCQNEADLAAVIAHEMTHVIKKHGLKELNTRGVDMRADTAMAELDEAAGPGPDEDAEAELNDYADSAYEAVHKPRLQVYEEEADRGAMLILARAGYDPAAVPRMIKRVGAAVSGAQTLQTENPFAQMDYSKRQQKAEAFLARELSQVRGVANPARFFATMNFRNPIRGQ